MVDLGVWIAALTSYLQSGFCLILGTAGKPIESLYNEHVNFDSDFLTICFCLRSEVMGSSESTKSKSTPESASMRHSKLTSHSV
jgi:hypothetical protein